MRSFHLKPWSSFTYRDILDYCFIASTCNFEQLIAIVCVIRKSTRFSAGAVDYGEGDCVPAQSGSGQTLRGGGVVLPAPPHREL